MNNIMADDDGIDNDDDITAAAAIVTPAQSKEQEELHQGEALLEQLWNGSFSASTWDALSATAPTMEVSAGWRESAVWILVPWVRHCSTKI
jgi:hypothetical protein